MHSPTGLIVSLSVTAGAIFASVSAQDAASLITLEAPFAAVANGTSYAATINTEMLATRLADSVVSIELPAGQTVIATRTNITQLAPDRFVWTGDIDGQGSAVFAMNEGHLTGAILSPGHGMFRVSAAPGQPATMREVIDEGHTCGNCEHHVHEEDNGGFVFSTKSAATSAMQDFTEGCDIGQPIDVYIAYTTNSRVAAGGTAAILAEIDLAIAQTNQAYANSGITTPLRLVGTEEVNYNELTGSFAALEDNLDRLRDPGDGFLDSLHASRDATGADLLALLLDGSFGSTLGLAQIRGAFSVNRWDRIADFVLAHELGHNRGSEHETRSSPITFPYARAHQFNASGARRTIMYSILSFATIPYFSNPNVNFMGVPTGIANSRDNARSHNELESEIASFRCSSTLCSTLYSFGELEFSSGTAFGLPDGTDIVWMKRFDVQANATNINQISVGVGILSTEPQDIWLAIFDDPNNDGNPSDATLIASFGPVSAETLKNVTLSIPPISVGSPGDRFFVGASLSQRSGDFPIGFTPGADGGRSFFFFGATENTVPGGTLLSITSNTAITALGNNNVNADLAQPFGQLDAADTVEFLSLLSANSTDAERAAPSSVRDAFDLFVHMNAAENLCP